jgi:hypothetical protein
MVGDHDKVVDPTALEVAVIDQSLGRLPRYAVICTTAQLNVDQVPIAALAMPCLAVGQQVAVGRGDDARDTVTVIAALPGRKQV